MYVDPGHSYVCFRKGDNTFKFRLKTSMHYLLFGFEMQSKNLHLSGYLSDNVISACLSETCFYIIM